MRPGGNSFRPNRLRRAANWYVLSAKKEETRLKRLEQLIECSAQGRPIPQFLRRKESE
ncbi:MAG: YdeI/OmpD-associated family protein [Acidobacteria bacterium]|nr:YdeI/OmpD-associated family protein [Acidobacteriota bacterium]